MNPCAPIRGMLYILLFMFSVVLLGLTAYRIHYTESLGEGGDILTSRSSFYDPVIVELLVTACLSVLFTIWLTIAIFARIGGPMGKYATENILMWPIWIMFLVGAAIATNKWHNLWRCRGSFKQCRILDSIICFSWICWGFLTISLIASLSQMFMSKRGIRGNVYGEDDTDDAYPETRATTAVNTVHTQPVAATA